MVSQIKVDDIARKEFPHAPGYRLPAGPNQQMKMVGHQGPGVNSQIPIYGQFRQSFQEICPVLIGPKYCCPFYAPPHYVM
jgi:hypothetical protein